MSVEYSELVQGWIIKCDSCGAVIDSVFEVKRMAEFVAVMLGLLDIDTGKITCAKCDEEAE